MNTPIYDVPIDAHSVQHFSYQVAGHGALLKVGDGKICKPLIPIELKFYQSVHNHANLLPFTAKFYGTVDLSLTTDAVNEFIEQLDYLSQKPQDNSIAEADEQKEIMNPWCAKVAKAQFNSYLKGNKLSHKYVVLEDLTAKYKNPCICDIKMGTRQHGDDAAPDKRVRHQKKVMTTTSLPLGIRLCGIQAFQLTDRTYKYASKYDGRKLTTETVKSAIANYFHNGIEYRLDVLKLFLEKLKEFYRVMQTLDDKFRFYSTSLLFVYEGDPEEPRQSVDLRMVDFAHTFPLEDEVVNDDGYLFGLKNLVNIIEEIYTEQQQVDSTHSKL